MQPFSQRVLGDEAPQLGHHRAVVPEFELGPDPRLERRRAQLVQAGPDRCHEVVVAEVLEHVPPPQGQGGPVRRGRGARLVPFRGGICGSNEVLEPGHVDRLRVDLQSVAAGHGDQDGPGRPTRPVGLEDLPEVEDVGLHAGDDPRWRRVAPDSVDEALDRDRMAGLAGEHREDRPLPATAERQGLAVARDLEGAEEAELERPVCHVAIRS